VLLRLVRRLERSLVLMELGVAMVAFIAMLALSLFDIVGRNFFYATFPGGDMILRQLVLWVALPGAALAVAGQQHLHLDPANLAARPRWKRAVSLPFNLASSAVCALLATAGWRFWYGEWQYSHDGAWLLAGMGVILPVAFGLLTLHFLLRAALSREDA
jgi:TRAP-type C4-dicarboxylate transport system permease small subunit